ncbi:MAG: YgfZ/GcvT domain-containing protein, partial [Planctomycetota bacterium]
MRFTGKVTPRTERVKHPRAQERPPECAVGLRLGRETRPRSARAEHSVRTRPSHAPQSPPADGFPRPSSYAPARLKTELLLPRHRRSGAELTGGEAPLVLCFGEVPDEYRSAREGAALFDRTRREALALSGPDAAGFLHRLLANAVRTLAAGQGNRNLLLSSKGKVLFDFDLAVGPESIHLSLPPGSAAALAKALDMYHFSEKLNVQDVSDAHAPLELCGPRAADIVARVAAIEPPRELHAHVDARFADAPLRVTALSVAGSFGWRLDAGPALAERLWDTLVAEGATPAGRIAHDCLRVEAGAAEHGVDIDDSIYP